MDNGIQMKNINVLNNQSRVHWTKKIEKYYGSRMQPLPDLMKSDLQQITSPVLLFAVDEHNNLHDRISFTCGVDEKNQITTYYICYLREDRTLSVSACKKENIASRASKLSGTRIVAMTDLLQ